MSNKLVKEQKFVHALRIVSRRMNGTLYCRDWLKSSIQEARENLEWYRVQYPEEDHWIERRGKDGKGIRI